MSKIGYGRGCGRGRGQQGRGRGRGQGGGSVSVESLSSSQDSASSEDSDDSDGSGYQCNICGNPGGRWICCDHCDVWYHLKCVGLKSTDITDADWYCSNCKT